ncbi:MAG: HAD-IIIC family phosphatase, partial [Pseudomonadota bacterium]
MTDRPTIGPLALAASFTVEPLADVFAFWSDQLGLDLPVVFAPHAHLYQSLLDRSSPLHAASASRRVLVFRWSDIADIDERESAVDELIRTVRIAALRTPVLVLVVPDGTAAGEAAGRLARLSEGLEDLPGVTVDDGMRFFQAYRVDAPFDEKADRLAHLPYTAEGMAALGTGLVRWHLAASRPPLKLLAVDCDNTLWGGVLGEDGPSGLHVQEGHRALQKALVRQSEAGRIITLASKNEETEVLGYLADAPQCDLRPAHILAHRIGWDAKSLTVPQLAEDFGVGLDAVLFLDDDAKEIAEMRSMHPSVQSVRVPAEADALSGFVEHLWLFDTPKLTETDRGRTRLYREEKARKAQAQAAPSLGAFLASLDLTIDIRPAARSDIPRLAQLTQRTNQFNTTLLRCDEISIVGEGQELFAVDVRDRFGEYGTVGAMRGRAQGDTYFIDLFLLSCRVLGRGVEHRMAAWLGAWALRSGQSVVVFDCHMGPRNAPARHFVEALTDQNHTLSARRLSETQFDPASVQTPQQSAPPTLPPRDLTSEDRLALTSRTRTDIYETIATRFTTAAAIRAAMSSARRRARPALAVPYAPPATELERVIAAQWEEVLGVTPIGRHDGFSDLGGKSVQLVR